MTLDDASETYTCNEVCLGDTIEFIVEKSLCSETLPKNKFTGAEG